jgi:hypothetical protein
LFLVLVLALSSTVAKANDIVVCKTSDPSAPVTSGTSFSFTIDGRNFTLVVGGTCVSFVNVGAGPHTITEAIQTGTVVSAINVSPPERLVSFDLTLRTVIVLAVDPDPATTVTFVNRQVPANQGCTPGFWKQDFHFGFWTTYSTTQTVGSIFTGVSFQDTLGSETLLAALQGGGGRDLLGAETILLRAAVAALLNASNGSIAYPFTTAQIITAVKTAIASGSRDSILALETILNSANNGPGGCPIGGQNP